MLLVVNIAVSSFIFSTLYSASRITIEPPSTIDVSVEGSVATFSAPFRVTNGGFYDVSNLNISISVANSTGFLLVENYTYVDVIKAGATRSTTVVLALNLSKLSEEGAYYNLFNDDEFLLSLVIGCDYAQPMIDFSASFSQSFEWGAPLYNFEVGEPSVTPSDSGKYNLSVPYSGENHNNLSFDVTIQTLVYREADGDELIGSGQTTFLAAGGSSFDGEVVVPIYVSDMAPGVEIRVEVYLVSTFTYGPIIREVVIPSP